MTGAPLREEDNVPFLKFVQVHTFYPAYLEKFYQMNAHLASASFKEQTDALINDGFSAVHMFAPYLNGYGYETYLIISNSAESQYQWLRENNVALKNPNGWISEITRQQIDALKPDILYISDPISFDTRFIRSLEWQPKLILGWRAASIPEGTDWTGFNVIMSHLSACRRKALELGANSVEHFSPGVPQFLREAVINEGKEYDVIFSGQWTPEHQRRNKYIEAVAQASALPPDRFSVTFFISVNNAELLPQSVSIRNQGALWGMDMYRALKRARIVINAEIDLAKGDAGNMRLFEVTGIGSFLLTEYHNNINEYFQPGVEMETFSSENELIDKIRYYLAHPDKREVIAKRGEERCSKEYSMQNRAAEFDRIIRKYLSLKSQSVVEAANSVQTLKEDAIKGLDDNDVRGAFNSIIRAKAFKQPLFGVDLLRATCFIRMNRIQDAIEALNEELRLFPDNWEAKRLLKKLQQENIQRVTAEFADPEFRQLLKLIRPFTMLGQERLYSLFTLAKEVCIKDIPGNFVECGVAGGGSSALLAYVIKRYSTSPRFLYSFDSFCGMPEPTEVDKHQGIPADQTGWGTGTCAAPESSLKEICSSLGVLDAVTIIRGYFQETLPLWRNKVGMISILHLDSDWFESTRVILNNLYDLISEGGILQFDDYGYWDGCRKAVHDFEERRRMKFSLIKIDETGVWFQKGSLSKV